MPGVPDATQQLAVALLAGSPRVAIVDVGWCRIDARGWGRRGGEPALAKTLQQAAERAGFHRVRVGIADTSVTADAATLIGGDTGIRIVAPGGNREFLSPLPLSVFPLSSELIETFRALGFQRASDIAERDIAELEARFGPEGVRAHRLTCGTDDQVFRALAMPEVPEAALELEPPADTLEPLLFVLRHLLARICAELGDSGLCAGRIELDLRGRDGVETAVAVPARPTRQERLLYDLCRAALERAAGSEGRLKTSVIEVVLRISRTAPPDARQEDLFTRRWRDPMAAAAALSRLSVRLGHGGVVRPAIRLDHRPESRSVWESAEIGYGSRVAQAVVDESDDGSVPIPGVLHLFPAPLPLRVRMAEKRPAEMWSDIGHHELIAAEGPERLSGDWWKDPYHREYFRVCTKDAGLLWLFREYRPSGDARWWLHGWWD
jgi:protein ImuB